MEEIIKVDIIEESVSIVDCLPYIISILSILVSLIIVFLQYRQTLKLQEKKSIYVSKKETLYEVLSFLDEYISWLTPMSNVTPMRKDISELEMTLKARLCYNKLCLYCNNDRLLSLFWEIVCPNNNGQPYEVYKLYNEFRNECRKELGMKSKELPSDNIFLSIVSTRELNNK